MRIPRTLAIILAGGEGSRMDVLTAARAKPSLRVAGSYRLIDVALSNLANSQISDVWIVEQYLPHTLNAHLSAGRPWDLDRSHGGLQILAPFTGGPGEGFATGNSDSLWRFREQITAFGAELVLVLSADHLYTLDLRDVIATHSEAKADLTIVTTAHDDDASRHGVVKATPRGRVSAFWYKPEEPPTDLVATEVFCFGADALVEALEELGAGPGAKESGLEDYGDDLVPWFVENRRTVEHRLEGYWRDIGTIESYWRAHMHILDGTGPALDDPDWPIRSAQPQLLPAKVEEGAAVSESLLAAGSSVAGTVRRSVLSPGARVDPGAEVTDCVLLDGARVGAGVHLKGCIVDVGAQVVGPAEPGADGAELGTGGTSGRADGIREVGAEGQVTVIGPDGAVAEVDEIGGAEGDGTAGA